MNNNDLTVHEPSTMCATWTIYGTKSLRFVIHKQNEIEFASNALHNSKWL